MGSSTSGLLDRASCGVCFKQYDNENHVPKILPCEHTYCQSCLQIIGAETVDIKCPECRTNHEVPERGFMTNRALLDVVDELLKVLMCEKHPSKERLLLCVECLECRLCIRLWQKFKSEIQLKLQETTARMKQLEQSVAQKAKKAESDIKQMRDKVVTDIMNWKEAQLVQMTDFKEKAAKQMDTIYSDSGTFVTITLVFMVISLLSLLLLYTTQNISIARLVGLDVDSIIDERLHKKTFNIFARNSCKEIEIRDADLIGIGSNIFYWLIGIEEQTKREAYIFSIKKCREQVEHEINFEISLAIVFCAIVFQFILHKIASSRTSDSGLISGIKFGCRYFVIIHVGLMFSLTTLAYLWADYLKSLLV